MTALGGSGCDGWGGGGEDFSGWHILKYPARWGGGGGQVDVEICVYFKKLYFFVKNVLKLNIRALSILIVSHKYPLYLMYDNRTVSILSTNCAVCL